MRLVDVAEVLYQIRLALEDVHAAKRVPFVKMYLGSAETILVAEIRRAGEDPGKSVADVDALKLRLIRRVT